MKKGHFDSKTGGNGFSKNWNGILRPAINEWRPKSTNSMEDLKKKLHLI